MEQSLYIIHSIKKFLCGLTLELSQQLRSICELESSSKLLFQQSVEDVQQVCLCTSFA